MTENRRALVWVASATVVLGILLGVRPVSIERLLAGYALVLAAIVLFRVVTGFRRGAEPPQEALRFEQALRGRPRAMAVRPPAFIAMEREIEIGMDHAGQAHRRLLPLLRTAAAARLALHHGVELEHRPDVARDLLGEEAWDYLRPDRPEPVDRHGPGPSRDTIETLIARVESL